MTVPVGLSGDALPTESAAEGEAPVPISERSAAAPLLCPATDDRSPADSNLPMVEEGAAPLPAVVPSGLFPGTFPSAGTTLPIDESASGEGSLSPSALDSPTDRAARPASTTRRDLLAMTSDGVAAYLMIGMGESYLPAFITALGLGDLLAGLIVTIPLVVGSLMQMIAPWMVSHFGSYRRWVVACSAVQACCFLPLAGAALLGKIPGWAVVGIFTVTALYWGSGLGANAAWNAWSGTIVPSRVRARYFGRRNRWGQGAQLIGFVLAGLILQGGRWAHFEMAGFAIVFLLSAGFRGTSTALLAMQSEPDPPRGRIQRLTLRELIGRLGRTDDGRLLLYLLAMQFGVQLCGPYFAPFILRKLAFEYHEFMFLIGTSFVFKSLAAPWMGSFAHRYGPRALLILGGITIAPMSLWWLFSNNFWYLVAVQATAGTAWSAFELAMFLMYAHIIPTQERARVLSAYNVLHALASAAGSLCGGYLLWRGDFSHGAYMLIFGLSFVLRSATIPMLWRVPAHPNAQLAN